MTDYFAVRNFEKFQHYRDRSPPWIKLYKSVLDDYEFGNLDDASKAHLVAIWLLASRYDNRVPFDAGWIARRINATATIDLQKLVDGNFIVLEQDCSMTLADRKQNAVLETETETERETEAEKRQTPRKRGTRIPPDWRPTESDVEYAVKRGVDVDGAAEAFKDWWMAAAGRNSTKRDWSAAWRTWVRNNRERRSDHGNRTSQAERRQSITRILGLESGGDDSSGRQIPDSGLDSKP